MNVAPTDALAPLDGRSPELCVVILKHDGVAGRWLQRKGNMRLQDAGVCQRIVENGVFHCGKDQTDVGGIGCLCKTNFQEWISNFAP